VPVTSFSSPRRAGDHVGEPGQWALRWRDGGDILPGSSLTGTSQVKFGSVSGTAVTVVNDQQVRVAAPQCSTAQTVDIQLTTAHRHNLGGCWRQVQLSGSPVLTSVEPPRVGPWLVEQSSRSLAAT